MNGVWVCVCVLGVGWYNFVGGPAGFQREDHDDAGDVLW